MKHPAFSILVLLVALVLAACGTPAAQSLPDASPSQTEAAASPAALTTTTETTQAGGDCRTIEHQAGQTDVCGQPQKVVALSPHMLDILLSLGVQPAGYAEVEGVGLGSEFGEPAQQIKYLGSRVTTNPINVGTRDQPSLETLVQLAPDLILYESDEADDVYTTLSQIAPTIAFIGPDRDDWKATITPIARALGVEDRAQQVGTAHDQRIAQAREELAPLVTDQQVMLLAFSGLNEYNPSVFGLESFAGGILDDLGIRLYQLEDELAAQNEADGISLETLAQTDPDSIIVMASGDNTPERATQEWAQTPILSNMRAYREGRVYFVDYQLWSRIRGPIAAELLIDEVRKLLAADQGASAIPAATADADGGTRTVTDALGTSVTIPTSPQRVALVGNSGLLPHVTALDVRPLTAPVDFGDGDRAIAAPPGVDVSGIVAIAEENPDLEQLLLLKPDLIIGSDSYIEEIYDQLAQIAPTVAVSHEAMFTDWRAFFRQIADVLNRQQQAEERIAATEAKLQAARSELAEVDLTVTLATVYPPGFDTGFAVWYAPYTGVQLLNELGIQVVHGLDDTSEGTRSFVSAELFPRVLTGDVLFLLQTLTREEEAANLEQVKTQPLWQSIPAVQNGNVHVFNRRDFGNLNVYVVNELVEQIKTALLEDMAKQEQQ